MGWDYYTYMVQPIFFVEAVKDFLIRERKAELKAIQNRERESRQHRNR